MQRRPNAVGLSPRAAKLRNQALPASRTLSAAVNEAEHTHAHTLTQAKRYREGMSANGPRHDAYNRANHEAFGLTGVREIAIVPTLCVKK